MSGPAASAAARNKLVLCESRRRLPEMPRIRVTVLAVVSGLDELQLGEDGDVVRERRLAAREWVVPVDPEVRAVDLRGQVEADALGPVRIGHRRGHLPGHCDRLGDALDRQLAVDRDLAVAVEANVLSCEAELRVPLGVEEVGRLQMGREVLVPHVHTRDLRRALERRALSFDGQLGSDLVELPLERPGEVANLEVDSRMNGVEIPGTCGGNGQNWRAHRFPAPFVASATDILATAKTLPDWLLRMQVHSKSDVAGLLDRLVARELPSGSGLEAWDSFLRAHAT